MTKISAHIPKIEDTHESEEECGCSSISSDVSIVSSADLNGGHCRCINCPGADSLHDLSADFEGDAADITHKKCSIIKLIRSQNQEFLEGPKYIPGNRSMEQQSAALDGRLPERSARPESRLTEWLAVVDNQLPERSTQSESLLLDGQSTERHAQSESRLIEVSALVEKQLREKSATSDGRLPERPALQSTIERTAQLAIQAAEPNNLLKYILLVLPQVLFHQGLGVVIALFTILALLLIGIVIGAGSYGFSYGQINSPLISCLAWYLGLESNSENYYSVF